MLTTYTKIIKKHQGKIYSSGHIRFPSDKKPRDYAFQAFDLFLEHIWLRNDLVRLDIHPLDLQKDKFHAALEIIEKLRKNRELTSYQEYLDLKKS